MKPLFILSLPRSGSTLVQRILATHPDISTASEPWILLPYLYSIRNHGIYTEYVHSESVTAIEDFIKELPNGKQDYFGAIRKCALHLYKKASKTETTYFLDKTPRYHLVIDDLIQMFPDGKFIFLWRNPLGVAASIIETWGNSKWNLHRYKVDLFDGLNNLLMASEKYKERIHEIKYEDLLSQPDKEMKRLFDYIELEYDPQTLNNFSDINLNGRLGDPTGAREYKAISTEPLGKWKKTLSNPHRKLWSKHYLRWIGEEKLSRMGYEMDSLISEVDKIDSSGKYIVSDLIRRIEGFALSWGEPVILMNKLRMRPDWWKVHAHR